MAEASLSKLDDRGLFTIVNVKNVERKVGKEIITEVNIETEEDFDGVEALEVHYEANNGILDYIRDKAQPITSAERAVSDEGYKTLLQNISNRLGVLVKGEEAVETIIEKLSEGNAAASTCMPEQREADACVTLYNPVCGEVHVQCITAPCPPVYQTFPNSCEACRNSLVESYTQGECLNG
mgnify:CR=1 FL=1